MSYSAKKDSVELFIQAIEADEQRLSASMDTTGEALGKEVVAGAKEIYKYLESDD